MKKRILVIIISSILVLLTGCVTNTNISQQELEEKINLAVREAFDSPLVPYTNMTKSLYSFYLPAYVGHRLATKASDTLVIDSTEVLMSLNASSIIGLTYYKDNISSTENMIDKNALFSKSYIGFNADWVRLNALVNVYEIDNEYFLIIKTDQFYYLARIDINDVADLVKNILYIARNTSVNNDEVVIEYSTKEVIDYQQKEIETIFNQKAPENGTLEEMLVDYVKTYEPYIQEQEGEGTGQYE